VANDRPMTDLPVENVLPLPDLSRELLAYTGGRTVSYRRLYTRVLNGSLPARRSAGNRWLVDRDDIPAIAAQLGLKAAS
jgi:hypothetical protein